MSNLLDVYKACERYESHGDERPSLADLETGIQAIDFSFSTNKLLIAADMCIDLAMLDPDRCDEHLAASRKYLEISIGRAMQVKKQEPDKYLSLGGGATRAHMRRGELASWRQASLGEKIEVSYLSFFKSLIFSQQFKGDLYSQGLQLELIPLLLGARALETGKSFGYVARLGLVREENRRVDPETRANANLNWDCGVFIDLPVTNFDTPTRKLQVKGRAGGGSRRKATLRRDYARGGIQTVSAAEFGFREVDTIKEVCLAELKNAHGNSKPGESARVDLITANLFASFKKPI